jgi:hypothetical protein
MVYLPWRLAWGVVEAKRQFYVGCWGRGGYVLGAWGGTQTGRAVLFGVSVIERLVVIVKGDWTLLVQKTN